MTRYLIEPVYKRFSARQVSAPSLTFLGCDLNFRDASFDSHGVIFSWSQDEEIGRGCELQIGTYKYRLQNKVLLQSFSLKCV